MTAVVPVSQIRNLPEVQREHAITSYLEQARDRLTDALAATGPEAVAAIKAEVSTVAEMTKQLGLSKECRDDATEMVRRAEYALGKAIRKGQEEGAFAPSVTITGGGAGRRGRVETSSQPNVRRSLGLHAQEQYDMGAMSTMAEAEFEDALTEARDEGNLSRANVVRKIKQQSSPQTRDQRADQIADLAQQGYTSIQISPKVGMSAGSVRQIARDFNVDIPADRAVGKRRHIDSNRILAGAAESVAATAYSLQQINPLDLDQDAAQEWVDSLTVSINALRQALKPIKESLRD